MPRTLKQVHGIYMKPTAFYDPLVPFIGEFDLLDEREWPDLVQTGAITFSEGPNAVVGGCDRIKITANGSAINVPGGWVNVGSAPISTTNGDVNRIIVTKSASEIQYAVKVN